ncbi:MAG: dynamin family protein [Deltaproteobacteria bacterium]|nr:dynamin family protein [Deltaproteobacteria bacterium]
MAAPARHVRIVVIGTTSAGKSTLTNALLGRWLLPSGVQEVTRAAVRVRHSRRADLRKMRTARGTPRFFSSDAAVRRALGATLQAPGSAISLDVFIVRVPVCDGRTGDDAVRHAIVTRPGASVALVDCPGLRSASDAVRLAELRRACRAGHVVVLLLSAEETDPTKDRLLIEAVLRPIADGALSARRAIFVLSRFDAFERDDDPMRAVETAEMDRVREIRRMAASLRPGWRLGRLDVLGVAPRAALIAEALGVGAPWLDHADRAALEEELETVAMRFVPWVRDLPRRCSRWSTESYAQVIRDLRVASGMADLLNAIRRAVRDVERPPARRLYRQKPVSGAGSR